MRHPRSPRPPRPSGRTVASSTTDRSARNAARDERTLLTTLDATLSEEEARRVFAGALGCLDAQGRARLFARLGAETGKSLRVVLEPERAARGPQRPAPGRAKVEQEWKALWANWEECVEETGHEGGKYVQQEERWEAPWLDASGLADDLENVAAEMRRLLGRVWDLEIDPECSLADAVRTAAESVGAGLPEWMDHGEDLAFGPEVTGCLLDWEWRAARRDGRGAFAFVEQVRDVERSLGHAGLDDEAIADFVTGLDADDKQAILHGLTRHRGDARWKEALDAPHTGWFRAWRKLAERSDPALFSTLCRDNIERDWTLALPLLKGALARKDFAQADAVVRQALPGMLGSEPGLSWDPRQALLIRHPYYRYRQDWSPDVFHLLEAWRTTAEALGRTDEARAIVLQLLVARKRDDWDAIVAALRDVQASCALLIADWRSEFAESSVRATTSRDGIPELGWLHALVDAVLAGADGRAFREAVRKWLREAAGTPALLHQCEYSLATLLMDVDGAGHLRRNGPKLVRLLSRDRGGSRGTDRTRQRWIEQLGGFELYPEILAFWKRNAAALVPDPGRQEKSDYERCAEWMAAILELDRDAYDAIIGRWSVEHRRRRNLWQAFGRRGLPGGPRS